MQFSTNDRPDALRRGSISFVLLQDHHEASLRAFGCRVPGLHRMPHTVALQERRLGAQSMPKEHPVVVACRSKPLHSVQSGIRRIAQDIYPRAPFADDLVRSFRAVVLRVLLVLEKQDVAVQAVLLPAQWRHYWAEAQPGHHCRWILQNQPAALRSQRHEPRQGNQRKPTAAAHVLLIGRLHASAAVGSGPRPNCKAVPDPYIPRHRRSIVRDRRRQVLQKRENQDRRRRKRNVRPVLQTLLQLEPPRSIYRFQAVQKTTHADTESVVRLLSSDRGPHPTESLTTGLHIVFHL